MIKCNYILTILLLLTNLSAYSQKIPDSSYWEAEMEDSISAMSFVRIRKPKALLDSIIAQVIRDSQQKPVRSKYQVETIGNLHRSTQNTSRCILHAIANIRIKATGEGEDFHYEGPPHLRNLRDTASEYYSLKEIIEGDYMLRLVQKDSRPEILAWKYLMSLHHIKVYSISDESGRGVYRVDFSPRKHIGYGYCASKFKGTAYFDKKTLRIKQIETDKISPTSWDITGKRSKKLLSHTLCLHFRTDYEEVGGTLVVKHIENTYSLDNQLTGKSMVQRLP